MTSFVEVIAGLRRWLRQHQTGDVPLAKLTIEFPGVHEFSAAREQVLRDLEPILLEFGSDPPADLGRAFQLAGIEIEFAIKPSAR
jgi:hypothetical protein